MSRNKRVLAKWLRNRVLEHLEQVHTDVKPTVLRRAAQRIGLDILGNRLTCWDPVHLGSLKTTLALEHALRDRFGPMIDLACQRLFHGHIIPIQRAMLLIDEAHSAALGKCVCRSSGTTNDVTHGDEVYSIADSETTAHHLDNILTVFRSIRSDASNDETTSPKLMAILDELLWQDHLDPETRLGLLWKKTFPYWEILLTHDRFTKKWRDNMRKNKKSWPVHRQLLKALAQAQYHTRGAFFTAMEVVDETYAMCTCPGPENDDGCSLVNWYYFSRMDGALFPNTDDFFGQAVDEDGNPVPCKRFAERQSRPCLGCGCEHEWGPKLM